MSDSNIAGYINDHLGGSAAALDLIEHLAGLENQSARTAFFRQLIVDIKEERRLLAELLGKIDAKESRIKQAAGSVAEKVSRIRLQVAGLGDDELGLFEAFEMLSLGIHGKMLLWRALGQVAADFQGWDQVDFSGLERKAREQRDGVEAFRLQTAARALSRG